MMQTKTILKNKKTKKITNGMTIGDFLIYKLKTNTMNAKQIIITGTLLVSVATFAQKDELKGLKKIYAKEEIKGADLTEYKNLVTKVGPLATEEGDKVYANFYKAMVPILEIMSLDKNATALQAQSQLAKSINSKTIADLETGLTATLDYEKKTGKKVYTDDINETIASFKPELVNYAIGLENKKMFKESSEVLYSVYKLDKKESEYLFYAANYALQAKDYDASLKYFNELKAINYTGEKTIYYAKNKANDQEEPFATKKERDDMVKIGSHAAPRDEKVPSKKADVYKGIASILIEQGKTEEAKAAIAEARKVSPNDSSLILAEADLYYKLNDIPSYQRLIKESLDKNPNDVNLVFNLGVTSANANQLEEAEKYYRRAIEIDPKYINAYINLSELLLRADGKFVKEMNSLGTSEKDNKRYDALKAERAKNFNKIIPILEKAVEVDPKNEDIKASLASVRNALK